MPAKTFSWLSAVLFFGLLFVGWPYWMTPYERLDITSVLGLGIAALAALTALAIWRGAAHPLAAGGIAMSVIPTVVASRAIADIATDPTSHSLWPFELAFAGVFGITVAAVGVAVGLVIRQVARSR